MPKNETNNGNSLKRLERGVFTISLDFELIWGTLDLFGPEKFRRACEIEREIVIDRLLDLFVEFEFPATWCIVGHLFQGSCNGKESHQNITRPDHSWVKGDWFDHDPCEEEHDRSVFLGRSLVEKVKNCPVKQEIGSHSFSHIIFGDKGCSKEAAKSELAESVRLAGEMGIDLKSFAFPRNSVGHIDLLKGFGFSCYRGVEPNWYETSGIPGTLRRMMRLLDVIRVATPPTVVPIMTDSGVWNVPGSAMYFPMHGIRKYMPVSFRTGRIKKGLDVASESRRVFHLWFHPTNMAFDMESMFEGLRSIFAHARALKKSGKLDFLTMGDLATQHV